MDNNTNIIAQYTQLLNSTREAALKITRTLDSLQWTEIFKPIAATEAILEKQVADIRKLSNFAEQALDRLSWKNIGILFQPTLLAQDQLRNSLLRISESYKQLCQNLEINFTVIPNLSPIVVQQPPTDFYLATHLSDVITEIQLQLTKDEETVLEINHKRTNSFLCDALSQLDLKLLTAYQGAIDSLDSKNPDKQRHLAVSLRELFTHVLHILSPDGEFAKWNRDPANLQNGKPTRRGRLFYIYRKINFSPFSEFIRRDVDAALTFLKLFQKGTHKAQGSFDDQQCRALLIRMESLLYFIIKANIDSTK
ncbi:hypothetical protein ES707_14008 [subsurface metagenome]